MNSIKKSRYPSYGEGRGNKPVKTFSYSSSFNNQKYSKFKNTDNNHANSVNITNSNGSDSVNTKYDINNQSNNRNFSYNANRNNLGSTNVNFHCINNIKNGNNFGSISNSANISNVNNDDNNNAFNNENIQENQINVDHNDSQLQSTTFHELRNRIPSKNAYSGSSIGWQKKISRSNKQDLFQQLPFDQNDKNGSNNNINNNQIVNVDHNVQNQQCPQNFLNTIQNNLNLNDCLNQNDANNCINNQNILLQQNLSQQQIHQNVLQISLLPLITIFNDRCTAMQSYAKFQSDANQLQNAITIAQSNMQQSQSQNNPAFQSQCQQIQILQQHFQRCLQELTHFSNVTQNCNQKLQNILSPFPHNVQIQILDLLQQQSQIQTQNQPVQSTLIQQATFTANVATTLTSIPAIVQLPLQQTGNFLSSASSSISAETMKTPQLSIDQQYRIQAQLAGLQNNDNNKNNNENCNVITDDTRSNENSPDSHHSPTLDADCCYTDEGKLPSDQLIGSTPIKIDTNMPIVREMNTRNIPYLNPDAKPFQPNKPAPSYTRLLPSIPENDDRENWNDSDSFSPILHNSQLHPDGETERGLIGEQRKHNEPIRYTIDFLLNIQQEKCLDNDDIVDFAIENDENFENVDIIQLKKDNKTIVHDFLKNFLKYHEKINNNNEIGQSQSQQNDHFFHSEDLTSSTFATSIPIPISISDENKKPIIDKLNKNPRKYNHQHGDKSRPKRHYIKTPSSKQNCAKNKCNDKSQENDCSINTSITLNDKNNIDNDNGCNNILNNGSSTNCNDKIKKKEHISVQSDSTKKNCVYVKKKKNYNCSLNEIGYDHGSNHHINKNNDINPLIEYIDEYLQTQQGKGAFMSYLKNKKKFLNDDIWNEIINHEFTLCSHSSSNSNNDTKINDKFIQLLLTLIHENIIENISSILLHLPSKLNEESIDVPSYLQHVGILLAKCLNEDLIEMNLLSSFCNIYMEKSKLQLLNKKKNLFKLAKVVIKELRNLGFPKCAEIRRLGLRKMIHIESSKVTPEDNELLRYF